MFVELQHRHVDAFVWLQHRHVDVFVWLQHRHVDEDLNVTISGNDRDDEKDDDDHQYYCTTCKVYLRNSSVSSLYKQSVEKSLH